MGKIGITKEIDSLDRLQIPKEIRKRLGLGSEVELVIVKDGLLIKSSEYVLTKTDPLSKIPLDKPSAKL